MHFKIWIEVVKKKIDFVNDHETVNELKRNQNRLNRDNERIFQKKEKKTWRELCFRTGCTWAC